MRRFGGFSRTQFEIAGVKQRFLFGEKEKLGRTENVTGGQQHYIETVHRSPFAEGQHMLDARPWEPRLHESRSELGDNDLVMRRNVIVVRMRNEGEALCVPRVEPQILGRQIKTALIPNMDHAKNLPWIDMSETVFARQSDAHGGSKPIKTDPLPRQSR